MSCPSIDDLLDGRAADHAGSCDDCRAVLDLVAARTPADCGRAEALMAARAAGSISPDSRRLLSLHLASCASCALVADSLDAPEIAETLSSAAELDRSLDGTADTPGTRGAPGIPGAPGAPGPRGAPDIFSTPGPRGGRAGRAQRPGAVGESVRGVDHALCDGERRSEPTRDVAGPLGAGDRDPRRDSAASKSPHGAAAVAPHRLRRVLLAAAALLAIAAVAALLTRALG